MEKSLAQRVRETITTLNNLYGYGDVQSVKVHGSGRIEFVVKGYGMHEVTRRARIRGNSVVALNHQRKLVNG